MRKRETEISKFDEELGRVEFDELEQAKSRYRRIGNLLLFILIVVGLLWLGWQVYRRLQNPTPPHQENEVNSPNLWVPGIDYQPAEEEGD
ncbi:MAG: hypothetical protein ACUVUD_00720 [bacterium]